MSNNSYQFYYASIPDSLLFITNATRPFLGTNNLSSFLFSSQNLALSTGAIQVVNLEAPDDVYIWVEVFTGCKIQIYDIQSGRAVSNEITGPNGIQRTAFLSKNKCYAIVVTATSVLSPLSPLVLYGFSKLTTSIHDIFSKGLELIAELPDNIQVSTLPDGSKVLNFNEVELIKDQIFSVFKAEIANFPSSYVIQSGDIDMFNNVTNSFNAMESIVYNLKCKETRIFSGTVLFTLNNINNEYALNTLYANYAPSNN